LGTWPNITTEMIKLILAIMLIFSGQVYAAAGAATVWELRDTATGGATNNGGGYDSSVASAGTDYTLQDNAQFSGSTLSTSNGTTNPCVVSSGTHNFVSSDNGNFIHIISGGTFTAGWYEIASTSGNNATLDKACASGASTSGGTWAEGGALVLNSAADTTWAATLSPGNTVWIKNGSYTAGGGLLFPSGIAATTSIKIAGYNGSRNDNPTGSNRPLITMGSNILTLGSFNVLKNIRLTGQSTSVISGGINGMISNVKAINTSTSTNRNAISMTTDGAVIDCELASYRGNAIGASTSIAVIGSYLHDSNNGISNTSTGGVQIINNIIESNVTDAIILTGTLTTNSVIEGNTLYGGENKTGLGISLATGTRNLRIMNNIIYGFTTGISSADVLTASFDGYNDYFNNTADVSGWVKGIGAVAVNPAFANLAQVTGTAGSISGSVITDAAANFGNVVNNQDFVYIVSGTGATAGQYLITSHTTTTITLDSAPGGSGTNIHYQVTTGRNFAIGTALKSKGLPGAFQGGLTTGYLDIGAAQRHEYGRSVGH
jgi:hypothetical protein